MIQGVIELSSIFSVQLYYSVWGFNTWYESLLLDGINHTDDHSPKNVLSNHQILDKIVDKFSEALETIWIKR